MPHSTDREWTGSVAVLPLSMRGLALEMANLAAAKEPARKLESFLTDHAYTLSEWADAIEQLYARLDEGEPITNAQGVALARFLNGSAVGARTGHATVSRGGAGLPESYLYVTVSDGYEGGIDRDGRTST